MVAFLFSVGLRPRKAWIPETFSQSSGPTFVTIVEPNWYSEATLRTKLRQGLTQEELALFVIPLASTPEMDACAQQLVAGSTNDLQKARMLYEALVGHLHSGPASFDRPPTAREVFGAWNAPGATFGCQEFAFLYVALARSVGLRAYHVCVQEDCRGIMVSHGCAAVFIAGKALLVDLTYVSFGVPHRRFKVLDDLQTAAIYLCGARDLVLAKIACKLAPDLAIVRASLFELLALGNRWLEAQIQLSELIRLDPEGALTYAAKGRMATHEEKLQQAVQLFRKAVELAPETGHLHFCLGSVYVTQGRWDEARKCYQDAVRYAVYENAAVTARGAIALLDGQECQAKGEWDSALIHYRKAVELRPDYFQAYFARGSVKHFKGDFVGAAADYQKAIELKSDTPEAYLGRGAIKYVNGDLIGAQSDFDKALSFSPQMGPALRMLGCVHYDRHEFSEALAAFRKACETAGPPDDYTHFRIYLARSRLGDPTDAIKELQDYLEVRKRDMADDWHLKLGQFLAGEVTEPDLFRAAESPDRSTDTERHCEAWFYAGTKRLLLGDRITSASYFGKCIATHAETLVEYGSALQELRLLGAPLR